MEQRHRYVKINNIWSMTYNSHKRALFSKIGGETEFLHKRNADDVPILHYFALQ